MANNPQLMETINTPAIRKDVKRRYNSRVNPAQIEAPVELPIQGQSAQNYQELLRRHGAISEQARRKARPTHKIISGLIEVDSAIKSHRKPKKFTTQKSPTGDIASSRMLHTFTRRRHTGPFSELIKSAHRDSLTCDQFPHLGTRRESKITQIRFTELIH